MDSKAVENFSEIILTLSREVKDLRGKLESEKYSKEIIDRENQRLKGRLAEMEKKK
jgi:regulator of replication initiation timing